MDREKKKDKIGGGNGTYSQRHRSHHLSADQDYIAGRAARRRGGLIIHVVAVVGSTIICGWGIDAIAAGVGVGMVCVVVKTVGIELHGRVGVGGNALRRGEGGVVTDEEPSLLAL